MTDFDALRRREFPSLDRDGLVYLDYTGAALPMASQLAAHRERLDAVIYGNPHSAHAASAASTHAIEAARRRVLAYFGVTPATHTVCFTANATAALKLVGESFPFGPKRGLLLAADNHNSVNGLRVFAAARRAPVRVASLDATLQLAGVEDEIDRLGGIGAGLFAFPAQSNFSGTCHPLALVARARARGVSVLLDAAAYVGTHRLDLAILPADFVSLSFYKMLGFPTGVGALIARNDALAELRRPWFAGGTVEWVSVESQRHELRAGAEGFEDGTPNFLDIPALTGGLDAIEAIDPDEIGRHARELARRFARALAALRHRNGAAAAVVYGSPDAPGHGAVVAFNLLRPDGSIVPFGEVESFLATRHVAVRGGCFCNPGAAEACLPRTGDRGLPAGALRASFGPANSAADLTRALAAIECAAGQPQCPPPSSLSAAVLSRS